MRFRVTLKDCAVRAAIEAKGIHEVTRVTHGGRDQRQDALQPLRRGLERGTRGRPKRDQVSSRALVPAFRVANLTERARGEHPAAVADPDRKSVV